MWLISDLSYIYCEVLIFSKGSNTFAFSGCVFRGKMHFSFRFLPACSLRQQHRYVIVHPALQYYTSSGRMKYNGICSIIFPFICSCCQPDNETVLTLISWEQICFPVALSSCINLFHRHEKKKKDFFLTALQISLLILRDIIFLISQTKRFCFASLDSMYEFRYILFHSRSKWKSMRIWT